MGSNVTILCWVPWQPEARTGAVFFSVSRC